MKNKDKKTRELTSETVKEIGQIAGADIVGIAAAHEFSSAPEGFRPFDYLDECLSVVVLGCSFPKEALLKTPKEYKVMRDEITIKMSNLAKEVKQQIKLKGFKAKSISSTGGKWIECNLNESKDLFGHISLKHAAELAGLGVIGRNYLLTNAEYGNLLWFSAVLTNADLIPDKKVQNTICDDCNKCVVACPSKALDNKSSFGKKGCSSAMYKMVDGKWEFNCFLCRKICPNRFGKINS